jgi:signal peptidase I
MNPFTNDVSLQLCKLTSSVLMIENKELPTKENSLAPKSANTDASDLFATFQWLVLAFILAFVFRAFFMEAYRIPTGSMAETLRGMNFRVRCDKCGCQYNQNFDADRYGFSNDKNNAQQQRNFNATCPNCRSRQNVNINNNLIFGDRILVLKYIYNFQKPKRWDVVVFKQPDQPSVNYVKRLVALPDETVEIIDGDIYIDGLIQRKPKKLQKELLNFVYQNDFQPVRPQTQAFDGKKWTQPFINTMDKKWQIKPDAPTEFALDIRIDQYAEIQFDPEKNNFFRASYAYNGSSVHSNLPYVSDLKLTFYLSCRKPGSLTTVSLKKHQNVYFASVRTYTNNTAVMKLFASDQHGNKTPLAEKKIFCHAIYKQKHLAFSNIDHMLAFEFDGQLLTHDLGRELGDIPPEKNASAPTVNINGSGNLVLSHITILRDIHYIQPHEPARARRNRPFKLNENEFFFLGDNSPNSDDSRYWVHKGRGNNDKFYRPGVVPKEFFVGKAVFVYWPGGYKLFDNPTLAFVPNLEKIKFIYGGK